jgi:hypothetical protein
VCSTNPIVVISPFMAKLREMSLAWYFTHDLAERGVSVAMIVPKSVLGRPGDAGVHIEVKNEGGLQVFSWSAGTWLSARTSCAAHACEWPPELGDPGGQHADVMVYDE